MLVVERFVRLFAVAVALAWLTRRLAPHQHESARGEVLHKLLRELDVAEARLG